VSVSSAPSRLLNAAAREVLRPIGLIQRGKSRTWIDDHGCWLIVVNFESSAFSKGSYLAVSADFLWHDRDWLAYAVGGRLREPPGLEMWVDFISEEQFAPEARRLAMRAADEVSPYRSRFPTLREWADELGRTAQGHFWREFDAGAAYVLLGQTDEAHRWPERVYEPRDDARDWYWRPKPARRSLTRCWQTVSSSVPRLPRRYDDSARC
jgi:hypothetical protein